MCKGILGASVSGYYCVPRISATTGPCGEYSAAYELWCLIIRLRPERRIWTFIFTVLPPSLPPLPNMHLCNAARMHHFTPACEAACRYAASNTRRNIESCGILGGKLNVENGVFSITTLIIPKQQGTSDTVEVGPLGIGKAACVAQESSLCSTIW